MNAALFRWISDSELADWVVDSPYIWPTLESIHFVSLCVLFGSVMMIDLRLIGFFRSPCAGMVAFLVRLSLIAFTINLATGILFFFGNTYKYVDNPAFELKLLLILAAGGNAFFYRLRLSHIVDGEAVSTSSTAVGYVSLLLWSGVIVCGRMITFYAR
jgi:hypothetical protein